MSAVKGLRERLRDGENIVCAEGYLWELEKRGFVCNGDFTPEVVIDYPERVKALHEEFAMNGSDVIEAFTYYAHREKLQSIGRLEDIEDLNKQSLRMAKQVADDRGLLMAGNICNTNLYEDDEETALKKMKAMFKEQVEWAVECGADYIIGETFNELSEAKVALESIQKYGRGVPAVITLAAYQHDYTFDRVPLHQALRELELAGADVVGLNCGRGPATMLPLLREAKKACKGPLAALPVPYRTSEKEKSFHVMMDPLTGQRMFPDNMESGLCNRQDIRQFAQDALQLGIRYIGLCCGANPSFLREVALAYGRKPELGKNAPNTSRNYYLKDNLSGKGASYKNYIFGSE